MPTATLQKRFDALPTAITTATDDCGREGNYSPKKAQNGVGGTQVEESKKRKRKPTPQSRGTGIVAPEKQILKSSVKCPSPHKEPIMDKHAPDSFNKQANQRNKCNRLLQTNASKPKFNCGKCTNCLLDCGTCTNWLLPFDDNNDRHMIKQIPLHAPPGAMGLAFQFLRTGAAPIIINIDPKCPFKTWLVRGDRLLSIDGISITKPEQLSFRQDLGREVVFARMISHGRPNAAYPPKGNETDSVKKSPSTDLSSTGTTILPPPKFNYQAALDRKRGNLRLKQHSDAASNLTVWDKEREIPNERRNMLLEEVVPAVALATNGRKPESQNSDIISTGSTKKQNAMASSTAIPSAMKAIVQLRRNHSMTHHLPGRAYGYCRSHFKPIYGSETKKSMVEGCDGDRPSAEPCIRLDKESIPRRLNSVCLLEGCGRWQRAKCNGYCQNHAKLADILSTNTLSTMKSQSSSLKPLLESGSAVYAAYWPPGDTSRETEPSWHPGVVSSCKNGSVAANDNGDRYGPVRYYSVDYDDGDGLHDIPDQFVFAAEDYLLQVRNNNNDQGRKKRKSWIGVKNIIDKNSQDGWAKYVGWYVATIDSEKRIFSLLKHALQAYDASVVHKKGVATKESDLNLPEDWQSLFMGPEDDSTATNNPQCSSNSKSFPPPGRACRIPNCTKYKKSKCYGYCLEHFRQYGPDPAHNIAPSGPPPGRGCKVSGCKRYLKAKCGGYCLTCFRAYENGMPGEVSTVADVAEGDTTTNINITTTTPTSKKSGKYCNYPECTKYKQTNCYGYCLTHKSHANPSLHQVQKQLSALSSSLKKNTTYKSNLCKWNGCTKYIQTNCSGYCLTHAKFDNVEEHDALDVCKVRVRLLGQLQNGFCQAVLPGSCQAVSPGRLERWEFGMHNDKSDDDDGKPSATTAMEVDDAPNDAEAENDAKPLAAVATEARGSQYQNGTPLSFEVALMPTKKSNGSLKCLAIGCPKNSQSRSHGFCRSHHNRHLMYTGQCGTWDCVCGERIVDFQGRCGKCHRWKGGSKQSLDVAIMRLSALSGKLFSRTVPPDSTVKISTTKRNNERTRSSARRPN